MIQTILMLLAVYFVITFLVLGAKDGRDTVLVWLVFLLAGAVIVWGIPSLLKLP